MATSADLEALRVQVEGLDIEENRAGSGAYGVVYKVTVKGQKCVAKKLHNILLQVTTRRERDRIVGKFRNECHIMSKLNHPNVVGFVGVHYTDNPDNISLIMERLHSDLAEFVDQHPETLLPYRIHILYDVTEGLEYLHTLDPPLVHRDLTAYNVLLTEDLTAKIGDLGVSRYLDPTAASKLTDNPGHVVHMPPESQTKNPTYTTKLDIFSFGNLILHTINGKLPKVYTVLAERICELSPDGKVELMRRSDAVFEEMGEQHCLHSLVVRCLHDRPEERPAIEEVSTSLRELCGRYPRESFLDACKSGHTESVSMHLENGADPNQRDEDGKSALLWACDNGHDEVVKRLIQAKADVNTQDKSGRSPLWSASFDGHQTVVERLIAVGANVNVQREDGATALYVAAQEGHLRVVETLLRANADVNIKANNHATALHIASQNGHDEVVQALLAAKATVNTQDKSGQSPLWTASFYGHQTVVERLIAAGANVNVQREDGSTALYIAAQEGHLRVVEILLGSNADVNIKSNNHVTALHIASSEGHDGVVRALLAAKATVNAQLRTGHTPLWLARGYGHQTVVERLIAAGANVNVQEEDGFTALHVAAQEGHSRVIELLLAANADVNIKTNYGETAYDVAKRNGHDLVCKKLTESKQCLVM